MKDERSFHVPTDPLFVPEVPTTGAALLLCAILWDAMHEERRYREVIGFGSKRARRLYRELRAWFLSGNDKWGSFQYICHALGIDYEAARDRMRRRLDSAVLPPEPLKKPQPVRKQAA